MIILKWNDKKSFLFLQLMLYSKSGVQLQNSSNRETDDPFVVAAINPMVGIGYHEHTCKYEKKRSKNLLAAQTADNQIGSLIAVFYLNASEE